MGPCHLPKSCLSRRQHVLWGVSVYSGNLTDGSISFSAESKERLHPHFKKLSLTNSSKMKRPPTSSCIIVYSSCNLTRGWSLDHIRVAMNWNLMVITSKLRMSRMCKYTLTAGWALLLQTLSMFHAMSHFIKWVIYSTDSYHIYFLLVTETITMTTGEFDSDHFHVSSCQMYEGAADRLYTE